MTKGFNKKSRKSKHNNKKTNRKNKTNKTNKTNKAKRKNKKQIKMIKKVGEILKKMYIDSALQREKKIDNKNEKSKKPKFKRAVNNISWDKFKMSGMTEK